MPYLVVALKLLVVPALLGWIAIEALRDPRLGIARADPVLIAGALVANQAALVLFALRMRVALAVFGIPVTLAQALRVHLQSVFYFFVLPMTVGLELARFAKIKAMTGGSAATGALTYALVADRLAGALAAFLLALALLPFLGSSATPRWDRIASWLPWIAAAGALTVLLALHPRVRAHAREVLDVLRRGRRRLLACLALAAATHLAFALAVHLAAVGTNLSVTPLQTLFAVSAGMLFVVIPVSFAGLSPVEAASLGVLVGLGIPAQEAAVFALITYLAKLVAALQGGAWEVAEGGGQLSRLLRPGARFDEARKP